MHTNFMHGFYRNACYCRSCVYIAGIGIFDYFCYCKLDLDPMTFIYELDPLEVNRICENELNKSMLSKVII